MSSTETPAAGSRPYRYATTHPIDEWPARDGRPGILHKDLTPSRVASSAQAARPDWMCDPQREILAYRLLLELAPPGPPRLIDSLADAETGRWWIRVESVVGAPLTEIGDINRWIDAAAWIGSFHAWADTLDPLPDVRPVIWTRGAVAGVHPRAVAAAPLGSLGPILALAHRADELVELLCAGPTGLIHGELTASNVVVPADTSRPVAVVDWELVAIGPRMLDLASLVVGWDQSSVDRMLAAYVDASGWADLDPARYLDAARLFNALRWIGQLGSQWRPPLEHRTDWLDEAVEAARRLGW